MFCVSLCRFHGLACLAASIPSLRAWERPKFQLDTPNTGLQTLQLEMSFGYMVADTVQMLLFDRDAIFLVHHLFSALYLFCVLHLKVGAISAVFVFFLGEVTNPIFNCFHVTRVVKNNFDWASYGFELISPVFTMSFVFIRSILSPPLVLWFGWKLIFHSPAIPVLWRMFMISLVFLGLAGSQIWSYKIIKGWQRRKKRKKL